MKSIDVISNARDELYRAHEILNDDYEAEYSMLLQDIELSYDRLGDLIGVLDDIKFELKNYENNKDTETTDEEWRDSFYTLLSRLISNIE